MRAPAERQALSLVRRLLAEQVGASPSAAELISDSRAQADAIVRIGDHAFVVEWKSAATVAALASAIQQSRRYAASLGGGAVPLVAVPFMGPTGRRLCEEAGVGWLDLSGNAAILAPGVRVLVESRRNLFKRLGRPGSPFAPKSARVTRWLLMHPDRSLTQREIARATDLDEGFTSRITAKLVADGLVVREQDRGIRVADPFLLLDAWRQVYRFSKHEVIRGHIPSRSSEQLLHSMPSALGEAGVPYALTGLSAAWLMSHFAAFRIVTVYVPDYSSLDLEKAGFRETGAGANLWLVVPNDEGVFHGASERGGVRCAHPVQVYLDLHEHPERATEAASHLRTELFDLSHG